MERKKKAAQLPIKLEKRVINFQRTKPTLVQLNKVNVKYLLVLEQKKQNYFSPFMK